MEKPLRIAIVGDSTAKWIRPYRNHKDQLTYGERLMRKEGYDVDFYIRPGMTSHDALVMTWQELMGKFYDVYIFSVGINDCVPRSYPKAMADTFNRTLIPNTLSQKIFFLFYRLLTATKIQKALSRFRLSRPWASPEIFSKNLKRICEILLKETDGQVIFVAPPPVSERVENILHGVNAQLPKYLSVIRKLKSERVDVLDLGELFAGGYDKWVPEGIHYSAEGHRKVFEEMVGKIESFGREGAYSCAE